MATQTKVVTAVELLSMPEEGYRYELPRGVLISRMLRGDCHGRVAAWTGAESGNYVRENGCGAVAAEIGYRLEFDPDTVRAADVAGIFPDNGLEPIPAYPDGPPDLAVEVKKLSQNPNETRAKEAVLLDLLDSRFRGNDDLTASGSFEIVTKSPNDSRSEMFAKAQMWIG